MYIKKHKNLDKKLWQDYNNLYPEVHDMLMAIAWDFVDYIRNKYNMNVRNSDIKDVILFGSTANYFYTKKSDIDVCLVLDTEPLHEQYPNLNINQTLKLYYYDWAMFHICKIRGRKVDLNFQAADNFDAPNRHRIGPNYSLLNSRWLYEPVAVSEIELKKIKYEANIIYKKIMQDFRKAKKHGFPIEEINELYFNIVMGRQKSVRTNYEQPITPMYLAHRKLNNHGIIEKLRTLATQTETKKFTLK